MPEWEPEIEVGEQLAGRLITAQFPELAGGPLQRIGEGWDYTIWATADRIAFRFPRRAAVIPGMRREMRLLPRLSAQLPVAVPGARYQGRATPQFRWPFFGSALIPGRELTDAGIPEPGRGGLARELGAFLRALHALAPPDSLAGVIDPNRRAEMGFRAACTREMIARIAPHWPGAPAAEPFLAAAEKLAPGRELVLSHGDLHLRQILVDGGRLSGVVDWVDICLAPASVDLAPLFSLFCAGRREIFLDAYGAVDPDTLLRARVLAICLSAMLAAYAIDRGERLLAAETLAELDRAVSG